MCQLQLMSGSGLWTGIGFTGTVGAAITPSGNNLAISTAGITNSGLLTLNGGIVISGGSIGNTTLLNTFSLGNSGSTNVTTAVPTFSGSLVLPVSENIIGSSNSFLGQPAGWWPIQVSGKNRICSLLFLNKCK